MSALVATADSGAARAVAVRSESHEAFTISACSTKTLLQSLTGVVLRAHQKPKESDVARNP